MNLGHAIKLCRTQRNLSLVELAERVGITPSYLSLLERNKRDPVFSVVANLAYVLNVPMLILLFLAADEDDLCGLSDDIQSKLAYAAFETIKKDNGKE